MSDKDKLKTSATELLNIEGIANVPTCPLCQAELGGVSVGYEYKRINPDTRWFWCPGCKAHMWYHRMKGTWKVDPYDLEHSKELRENFGLTSQDEV